ncbi:MAG: alanine racemase C-terminal domain-containing protein, partial [Merdibacter sp.]
LNYPQLSYDYVRPGLLYMGVTSDDEIAINTAPDFLPILSLKANVTMVKWLRPGDTVSYGRHFTVERPTKVATVSIGYADGLPRLISNQGIEVLLHGQRVKIIGNICMDQLMLDVTELEQVRRGCRYLIGEDGEERVSVDASAVLRTRSMTY